MVTVAGCVPVVGGVLLSMIARALQVKLEPNLCLKQPTCETTHANTTESLLSLMLFAHTGDEVYNYFEPEMDWHPFSVMLNESQIPDIHTILDSISLEQRKEMQVR